MLDVGPTRIPYRIRRSDRATHKRIVVQPGSVEVVLPVGATVAEAHALVHQKRRWVFTKSLELGQRAEVERSYLAGSKVRFRGRWLTLEVKAGEKEAGDVRYRSRFFVTLPKGAAREERAALARALLRGWLDRQLLADGERMAERYANKLSVGLRGVAVTPMKRMWASCGKDWVVRLNPELVELPKAVLEYVVAHEVCHLVHRNHSPDFWREVGNVMPDWRERQRWLNRYEKDWDL